MASSIRTLSQLPEASADEFQDISYLEVSVPISISANLSGGAITPIIKYASRKIKQSEASSKFTSNTLATLDAKTGIKDQNFGKMYTDYSKLMSGDIELDGIKTFKQNPIILSDAITDFDSSDPNYSVSLSALKRYTNINASPAIGPNFGFVTHLSGNNGDSSTSRTVSLFKIDPQNKTVENSPSYVFSPAIAKNISENEYIFRIRQGERESESSWVSPASGIFTCYGWLDEINSDKVSNENRWVALLGRQSQLGVWTILQVQPFIKNNYLSYVGFTFPVHKGMELKIQTGFSVGSNSDKYFRSNSSLANHIANAFLGGVYTGLSVDLDNLGLSDYSPINNSDIENLSNLIISTISHETSCDISVNKRIDKLEERLVTNDIVEELCAEVNDRVKYVDAANYVGINIALSASPGPTVRTATVKWGNGKQLSAGGTFGIFKQDVLQVSFKDGKRQSYVANVIDWSDGTFGAVRNYIPEYATVEEDNTTLYHPRDYTLQTIPEGTIFSDGIYAYYKVSQDSTVIIQPGTDPTDRGNEAICVWMMVANNNVTDYKKINVVHLISSPDDYSGSGETRSLALPLKKGTIIIVGLYMRERAYDATEFDMMYQTINIPAKTYDSFYNILSSSQWTNITQTFNGHAKSTTNVQTLTTHRIRLDGGNLTAIYDMNAEDDEHAEHGKWSWKDHPTFSSGVLLEIIELP